MTEDRAQVTLNGRDIAYRDLPGAGVPILLVHGIGSSRLSWGDVPDRIAASGRRVIAMDLPGHGDSSRGPGDYSLGAMACAVRDLLDHLGIARVHLVGHSLGGGISMQFIYQYPERVDALVLESSGGLGEEAFSGLRAAALPGADLALRVAINERTLAAAAWVGNKLGWVGIHPHALSPRALETVAWLGEDDRRAAFLATLRSVVGPGGQSVSALDKLHLMADRPVLIIWGDRDPMIPMAHGEAAHAMLPGSRFVVFPGAGHEPHVDDPARFADLIVDHIARIEAQEATATA
ncbi:MAG: alpha/beta fold hydrolase [Actinomycetota bacterium]|nr:alpha/beta fold hydrolase [Actinomycetota bacterium]